MNLVSEGNCPNHKYLLFLSNISLYASLGKLVTNVRLSPGALVLSPVKMLVVIAI